MNWVELVVLNELTGKKKKAMRMISDAVGRSDWTSAKTWAVRFKYLKGIDDAIDERAENE